MQVLDQAVGNGETDSKQQVAGDRAENPVPCYRTFTVDLPQDNKKECKRGQ